METESGTEKNFLKPDERIDYLKQIDCRIIQNPSQFCFGIDAVLLSHFAAVKIHKGTSVFDMCCGNGIISLFVQKLCNPEKVTGLEIQKGISDMAERTVLLNGLNEKIEIVNDDLKNCDRIFSKHSFDYVTVNPPYARCGHGNESPVTPKAIARHEIFCNLDDIAKSAEYLLKPNSTLFMIHRPSRLSEIFTALNRYKLEAKRMRFVFPQSDSEPTMVLIEARKNQKPDVLIEKPLVVYKSKGVYSDEVSAYYE